MEQGRNSSVTLSAKDCIDNLSSPISKTWITSKCDKEALLEQGHQWKQGQWTNEEVKLLQSNINEYCKVHGIDDPSQTIFGTSKERKDFYRTISSGLDRPLFSVYRRVIRMYDRKNYVGKYSPDELQQLKELQKRYGCDWTTIGNVIGRSASSVKDRCRLLKSKYTFGKWEPQEEEKLCEIVYRLSSASPGEDITTGLSWSVVSQHVGTRNEKQCRTKWLNYLNWKQKGGSLWTPRDDKLLLYRLSKLDAKDEVEVNWGDLSQGWPRSPQWLRCKWWSMKRKVSNYNRLAFREILSTLLSMFSMSDCSDIEDFDDSSEAKSLAEKNDFKSETADDDLFDDIADDDDDTTNCQSFATACLPPSSVHRFNSSEFTGDSIICNQPLPFFHEDFLFLGERSENESILETIVTMDDEDCNFRTEGSK